MDPSRRPGLLYLTRAQHKADIVRSGFWNQPEKAPTFLPETRTWGSFRDELTRRFGGHRAVLSSTTSELLAGRVWRDVRGKMQHWRGLPDTPTTRRELARLIDRWGHAWPGTESPQVGDTPDGLVFPGPPGGNDNHGPYAASDFATPERLHDLWLLLSSWQDLVGRSADWTDRAGAGRTLLCRLRASETQKALGRFLGRFESLVVDDLLWLSPLDCDLLETLVDAFVRHVPDGRVRLCLEDRGQDCLSPRTDTPGRRATQPLRRAWQRRLERGGAVAALVDGDPGVLDLADHLNTDGLVDRDEGLCSGPVQVRTYGSERAEVRALARSLRAEILGGRPPSDCYVAVPALDRYLPLLRDALHRYDIPFTVQRGHELRRSPPVSAARQVLHLALHGTDLDSMRALLASGWLRTWRAVDTSVDDLEARIVAACRTAGPEPGAGDRALLATELRDALPDNRRVRAQMDRVHRLCVRSGARGDHPRRWLEPILDQLLRDERRRARRDSDTPTGGPLSQRFWRRVARLTVDLEAIEAVAAPIRALDRPESLVKLAQRYLQLLDGLGIFDGGDGGLDKGATPETSARHHAALSAWRERIEEVAAGAQAVMTLCGEDRESPRPASNLTLLNEALEAAIRDGSYRVSGAPHGVSIVGVRDLHGADVPWLWLAGCVDGDWPRPRKISFLLPPALAGLLPERDPADEDRAIFLSLLRNIGHGSQRSNASLVVSSPRTVGGRDVAPSPLVQDLGALRLAPAPSHDGGTTQTLGDLWAERQSVEEAALPPVLSASELLVHPSLAQAGSGLTELLAPSIRQRIELHGHLHRSSVDRTGFGPRDGVLGLGQPHRVHALGWLADSLGIDSDQQARLTLPVTGLENWARCPMRFFFGRVLRIEEPEAWTPEPQPREQGTLLHRVLEQLLGERIDAYQRGKLASPGLEGIDDNELAEVKRRAAELVVELGGDLLGSGRGPYRERSMRLLTAGLNDTGEESATFKGKLASFLDDERTPFLGLEPSELEWAFEPLDPAQVAAGLDGHSEQGTGDLQIRVTGTIDRVDRSAAGRPTLGEARQAVYDYKTGKAPHLRAVDEGTQLQPAIYAAAVLESDTVEGLVCGYLELRSDGNSGRSRLAGDPDVLDAVQAARRANPRFSSTSQALDPELLASWLRRVDFYGQLIGSGVFPPTLAGPDIAGCEHCAFRRACRFDAVRTGRITLHGDGTGSFLPVPLAASKNRPLDVEEPIS